MTIFDAIRAVCFGVFRTPVILLVWSIFLVSAALVPTKGLAITFEEEVGEPSIVKASGTDTCTVTFDPKVLAIGETNDDGGNIFDFFAVEYVTVKGTPVSSFPGFGSIGYSESTRSQVKFLADASWGDIAVEIIESGLTVNFYETTTVGGAGTLKKSVKIPGNDLGSYLKECEPYYTTYIEPALNADKTAPTLTLETNTRGRRIEADSAIAIEFSFDEDVSDFTLSDIEIENAQPQQNGLVEEVATNFYTLSLDPDGNGDIKVTVPAGVYEDLAGNMNTQEVSIIIAVGDPVEEVTADVVKDGAKQALGDFIRANRNMRAFRNVFRRNFGGRGQANVDSQGGNGFLSLQGENGGWAELQGVWSDIDGVSSSYFHGALGFHNYVTDTMVVGGMLQFDRSDAETDAGDTIDIQGWMVGPYLLGEVPGQNLIYDLRVLYGRGTGDNEIVSSGTTGSFDLERLMVMGTLEGNYKVNEVTWSPYISGSYARIETGAYTDSDSNAIVAQTSTASEGELGLTGTFPMGDGSISAGLSAVASRQEDVSQDARGKLSIGLYQPVGGGDLTVDAFYDGLGRDAYDSYGVTLRYSLDF